MTSETAPNLSEVIDHIRERARARQATVPRQPTFSLPGASRPGPAMPAYDLYELHANLAACNALHNSVGTLNPRRPGLHNQAIQLVKKIMRRSLTWYTRPLHEFHGAVTRTLNETARAVEDQNHRLQELGTRIDSLQASWEANMRRAADELLSKVDTGDGIKAASGLFFNEPIWVSYENSTARWSATSERILERPWIFRQLADLPLGATILDAGCSESLLSFELASAGFQMVGVDIRDYTLRHPRLQFLRSNICSTPLTSATFDVAIALSTVEHIGIGAYGDPTQNASPELALAEIFRLLKGGGRLYITVPFGQAAITPLHHIYDSTSLRALLKDFRIEKLEFGIKVDNYVWMSPADEAEASARIHNPQSFAPGAVALAVCSRP